MRGDCKRNKTSGVDDGGDATAVGRRSSSEVAAAGRLGSRAPSRRDKGRLGVTRRVASAAESAAAKVRRLSEVQGRKSHPAAGRKHYGKPDELVLSNPCRDAR